MSRAKKGELTGPCITPTAPSIDAVVAAAAWIVLNEEPWR